MRRICLTLVFAVAAVAGCGSSNATQAPRGNATQAPGGGGNATATVTFNGQTYNLSGGLCTNAGTLGWDVAVGAWESTSGTEDYLRLIVNANKVSSVSGHAGGVLFALGNDQSGSIGSDLTGTFSGSDAISGVHIQGTFACH
jgi:hypothetical protein